MFSAQPSLQKHLYLHSPQVHLQQWIGVEWCRITTGPGLQQVFNIPEASTLKKRHFCKNTFKSSRRGGTSTCNKADVQQKVGWKVHLVAISSVRALPYQISCRWKLPKRAWMIAGTTARELFGIFLPLIFLRGFGVLAASRTLITIYQTSSSHDDTQCMYRSIKMFHFPSPPIAEVAPSWVRVRLACVLPLCPSGRCWMADLWSGRPPPGWSKDWGFWSQMAPGERSVPPTSRTLLYPSEETEKFIEQVKTRWKRWCNPSRVDNTLQFTSRHQSDVVLLHSDIKQSNQEPDITGTLIREMAFWAFNGWMWRAVKGSQDSSN